MFFDKMGMRMRSSFAQGVHAIRHMQNVDVSETYVAVELHFASWEGWSVFGDAWQGLLGGTDVAFLWGACREGHLPLVPMLSSWSGDVVVGLAVMRLDSARCCWPALVGQTPETLESWDLIEEDGTVVMCVGQREVDTLMRKTRLCHRVLRGALLRTSPTMVSDGARNVPTLPSLREMRVQKLDVCRGEVKEV